MPKLTKKPLTITIDGDNISLKASFNDGQFKRVLVDTAKVFNERMAASAMPPTAAPTPGVHDFDAVLRVLAHANADVLQSIINLATHELEMRKAAS